MNWTERRRTASVLIGTRDGEPIYTYPVEGFTHACIIVDRYRHEYTEELTWRVWQAPEVQG